MLYWSNYWFQGIPKYIVCFFFIVLMSAKEYSLSIKKQQHIYILEYYLCSMQYAIIMLVLQVHFYHSMSLCYRYKFFFFFDVWRNWVTYFSMLLYVVEQVLLFAMTKVSCFKCRKRERVSERGLWDILVPYCFGLAFCLTIPSFSREYFPPMLMHHLTLVHHFGCCLFLWL